MVAQIGSWMKNPLPKYITDNVIQKGNGKYVGFRTI